MWLSTKHNSVEMEGRLAKVNVLLPRIAKIADRSREKEMAQRIQDNIFDCTECYVVQQVSWQGDYIENGGLPTKTNKGRKHQRCKRG